jgi:hypothetical protein
VQPDAADADQELANPLAPRAAEASPMYREYDPERGGL